ncbi:MAG: LON peptidase substrate-binding domain-containing protein, partial [Nannocystaceae bacterium]
VADWQRDRFMLFEKFIPEPEVLQSLPVFPLPNVALFPGMVLPLQVFEPRYLALIDHVRETSPYFGVPMLRRDRRRLSNGQPALEPVLGIGRLHNFEALEDGRYLIQVLGVGRARTVGEHETEHPFRMLEVETLGEKDPADHHAYAVLRAQVERLGRACARDQQEVLELLLSIDDPRIFLYTIAALLPTTQALVASTIGSQAHMRRYAPLQQACLTATNSDTRCEMLLEEITRLLSTVQAASQMPSRMMN